MSQYVPLVAFSFAFAAAQRDSILCVWAPVVGSTKCREWLTVKCSKPWSPQAHCRLPTRRYGWLFLAESSLEWWGSVCRLPLVWRKTHSGLTSSFFKFNNTSSSTWLGDERHAPQLSAQSLTRTRTRSRQADARCTLCGQFLRGRPSLRLTAAPWHQNQSSHRGLGRGEAPEWAQATHIFQGVNSAEAQKEKKVLAQSCPDPNFAQAVFFLWIGHVAQSTKVEDCAHWLGTDLASLERSVGSSRS